MKTVIPLPLSKFYASFEKALAIISGAKKYKNPDLALKVINEVEASKNTEMNELEKALSVIAMEDLGKKEKEFKSFLIRSGAIAEILNDKDIIKEWSRKGWVMIDPSGSGGVAPSNYVLWAAAKCEIGILDSCFSLKLLEDQIEKMAQSTK